MPNSTQHTIRCNGANCVAIEPTAEGYDFVSTKGADKGRTSYDPAEVVAFLEAVKAGEHDGFLAEAQAWAKTTVFV